MTYGGWKGEFGTAIWTRVCIRSKEHFALTSGKTLGRKKRKSEESILYRFSTT